MSTPSTATISSARSSAATLSNCTMTMVASLSAAQASAAGKERKCRCGRPPALDRSPSGGNLAERAAVEHARDIVRRVGGNAHERRDPGFERGHADLGAGVEREARMLDIDIERVEAGGAGDAGDLHGA